MQIWFHRYELKPRRALSGIARPGVREGALLRIDGGYGDLHPWPELGDASLDEQLAILSRGDSTSQTRATMRLAVVDAEARARGVSLFEGLTIPRSHWPGNDPPEDFDTAKVKGGAALPERVRLRIDFNATLTAQGFLEVARTLPRERIDFVEDPTVYDEMEWRELGAASGLPLALDLAASWNVGTGFDVLVHKPAVQPEFPRFGGEIVVTSYMDHPVGQMGAAWVAATHDVSARCGLFTHVLFEGDPFIERVRAEGSRLLQPDGTGVGFDDLLGKLAWKRLL